MSKEMREYNKMHRKHCKELVRLAKNDFEWDWKYLHEIVITKIRHMYEYYYAGNNVCQSEESIGDVLETLRHVLDLQSELDSLWEEKHQAKSTRTEVAEGIYKVSTSDDEINQVKSLYEREEEIYKEMYAYIGEKMLLWWD